MKYIYAGLIAFFMGAVPYAYIVGRVTKHIDIREYGSKNPGAGNVFHLVSVRAGLVALAGDLLKGTFALFIINNIWHFSATALTYFGLIAVFGHVYSPFLKFRGGRGAATTLGDFLYITWRVLRYKSVLFFLIIAVPWVITLIITHSQVVSLAVAAPFGPFAFWFFTHNIQLVIAVAVFITMLELFGAKSLKREWKTAYSKYVSHFFKKPS